MNKDLLASLPEFPVETFERRASGRARPHHPTYPGLRSGPNAGLTFAAR